MSNPLRSIVCVSVMAPTWHSLLTGSLRTRFQDVQQSSVERYRQLSVTGLLICGGGYFLEWLEGEEQALNASIKQRQQETHHTGLRVVHNGVSHHRFARWSMYLLNRPDAEDSVGRQIRWLLACESERLQRWSPARMVRSVIKPPLLFRSGQRLRRVALFGASSLWISSFLAHLSSQWERPVVRTRVLHGEGFSSESLFEYLDVDHPSLGPLRWVNYVGTLLDDELMPLMVERLSMGVLFQTERDADSVLEFNARCLRHLVHQDRHTPLIAVVGRAAQEYLQPVVDAFESSGKRLDMLPSSMGENAALWQALRVYLQDDLMARPQEPDSVLTENQATAQKVPIKDTAGPMLTPQSVATLLDAPSAFSFEHNTSEADSTWLSGLLVMDGVEAVGWSPRPVAQEQSPAKTVRWLSLRNPRNTAPIDWGSILQAQEDAWEGILRQSSGDPLEQILVRWTDRLILSFQWPAESGGVLSVITRAGWINEALLRTQLREQLVSLVAPTPTLV